MLQAQTENMSLSIWNFKETKVEPRQKRCCRGLRHWEILGRACATAVLRRHFRPINFKFLFRSSDFPFRSEQKVTRQKQQIITAWSYEKIVWISVFLGILQLSLGYSYLFGPWRISCGARPPVMGLSEHRTKRKFLKLRLGNETLCKITCSWLCYCLFSSFSVCSPSYLAEIGMQEKMHQSQQLKWLHLTCSDSWSSRVWFCLGNH